MPARPRCLRRAIKWIGVGLITLILGVWPLSCLGSARLELNNAATQYSIRAAQGVVALEVIHESLPPDTWELDGELVISGRMGPAFRLGAPRVPRAILGSIFGYGSHREIPFWLIAAVLAIPTAFFFFRDRRAAKPSTSCPHCSYPLSGLPPQAPCPECGTRVEA